MERTAGELPAAHSTGAPSIAGNFAALKRAVTAFDGEVIGRVPTERTGRFLRIGPNPVDAPDLVRALSQSCLFEIISENRVSENQ